MRLRIIFLLACSCLFLYLFNSCKHKPFPGPGIADGNFPDSIANIFVAKCATVGCHDGSGYINADHLRLDSWDNLFKGASHGAVVIPFNTTYSSLLYFINTDSSKGIVSHPTMPYNGTPLSADEYNSIRNWIANGAPDRNGNIPFASNPDTRQKIYITQQGCDQMAVIDGASGIMMRLFPIGGDVNQTESPHCVRVTDDGKFAYVAFANGNYVQKIDTRTDTIVQTISLGDGTGGIISISPDGQKNLVSDFLGNELWNVDFSTGTPQRIGKNVFLNPHGVATTPNWDTFYVTAQKGNVIYRYVANKPVLKIPLDTTQPTVDGTAGLYSDPHEIIMTPDHSKFFVTCQNTNQLRVLDAHTYKVLAVLSVGGTPQELALSTTTEQVFVTCMEDAANPTPGSKGSVYVFNYNTLQQVGAPLYGDFYEPHGITIDEQMGRIYVVSANINIPVPPHHVTVCGSSLGWYTIYDLYTLKPVNNIRYETSNAPYSAAARFR